jgi:DNA-binding beta-propeller fold protein YncE
MKRFFWLGFVLSLYLICSGCGETFRPIIIPNPPTFPNPAAAHAVVSINDNGPVAQGTAMSIDVAGDSVMSIKNVDIHPVHAVQQSATQVLVLNRAVTGLGVATSTCNVAVGNQVFDVCPTLNTLNFTSTSIGTISSIDLPIYSSPNFVAVAPSATTAYVTLPTYPPNPLDPQTIVPSVAAVSTGGVGRSVTVVPVGTTANANPYALAVTPDNTKLYVANQGDGTIDAFNTSVLTPRVINGSLSSPPIWLSARSDSQAVYVLETSGKLAYIGITSTIGPDTLTETSISAPSAAKMVYDGNLNRLYIPEGGQVTIVDTSQSAPALLASVPITAVSPASRSVSDICSQTTVTTLYTVDVTAMPNGLFAYAGTYYEAAVQGVNYICPQVSVINATNYSNQATVAIPGFAAYDAFCAQPVSQGGPRFRLAMAAGGDSSRAYLASCDGGNVNIIDTSNNSYIENQPAPTSSPNAPASQNPVFLLAGP